MEVQTLHDGQVTLYRGDCLEVMPTLQAESIDLVLTDMPYGTTACKWDTIIPFGPMWDNVVRLAKKNAAIVLFGTQPYSSALVMSNPNLFKYEWVWDKKIPTGMAYARYQPMRQTENILIFSRNKCTYNPQITLRDVPIKGGSMSDTETSHYKDFTALRKTYTTKQPINLLSFQKVRRSIHPTQKPVALLEYLIRTYTNEGSTVLDFTMGSGSTGVACRNTNRKFIGIELDTTYYTIAVERCTL